MRDLPKTHFPVSVCSMIAKNVQVCVYKLSKLAAGAKQFQMRVFEPYTQWRCASPRRCIDYQVVYGPPINIFEELLDEGILAGAAPYDSIVRVL